MNILKYILLGLQYLPSVLQAVMAVEHASNNSPTGVKIAGPVKKALVLNSASAPPADLATPPPDHVQIISNLIEQVVTTLNSAGIFTHSK